LKFLFLKGEGGGGGATRYISFKKNSAVIFLNKLF